MSCGWPSKPCSSALERSSRPDPWGRVWMHCEEGLNLSKASMARFVVHCLQNNIEIGRLDPINPNFSRSLVCASVKLKPCQFKEFEKQTGGKLSEPPKLTCN